MRRVSLLLTIILVAVAGQAARVWPDESSAEDRHWAYVPPRRPALPEVRRRDWPQNPIDYFTLADMERRGLAPNPRESQERLLRRLTLDLTGLPPTIAELDAFLADDRPDAYQHAVARLLDSPHFGEHQATLWLDLARYADTHGYHTDGHRDMWRWRDWVIDALNHNMPFDQFTIEQLAGDLLPDAIPLSRASSFSRQGTSDQRERTNSPERQLRFGWRPCRLTPSQQIASGFLRNHMVNYENGAIAEQYRTEYVADRVETMATVWLAQTIACARCHDHKYDPISQREYFGLFAFFNNVPEQGLDGQRGNARPVVASPTRLQQWKLDDLDRTCADLEEKLLRRSEETETEYVAWEARATADAESAAEPSGALLRLSFDDTFPPKTGDVAMPRFRVIGGPLQLRGKSGKGLLLDGESGCALEGLPPVQRSAAFSCALWLLPTTDDTMAVIGSSADEAFRRGWSIVLAGNRVTFQIKGQEPDRMLQVRTQQALALRRWQHLAVTCDGSGRAAGITVYLDGQPQKREVVSDRLEAPVELPADWRIGRLPTFGGFRGMIDEVRVFARVLDADEVRRLAGGDPIQAILASPATERSAEQVQQLRRYYLENHDADYRRWKQQLAIVQQQREQVLDGVSTTMVMAELPAPRETRLLEGGRYDRPAEAIAPHTPSCLPAMANDLPRDRLGLARWLVAPDHPLTARVAVNRLWQQYFGRGLVETPEDFGSRGQPPSHPDLLDWLATEFVRSGWDVKHLHRLIVTSATYCQTSRASIERIDSDPDNRWLSRGPRKRLPAETIRDQALAVSGLLQFRIGGRSVFPYQPDGLWEEISFGLPEMTAQRYHQSHGADLYRRSLYTYWKRTSPPPVLAVFDAPSRETCVVRRETTNTPLQALALMNDTTFVEAARALAERILDEGGNSETARIAFAFRTVLARMPRDVESAVLQRVLAEQTDHYRRFPKDARRLLAAGEHPADRGRDPIELAAWATTAGLLLFVDETLTD